MIESALPKSLETESLVIGAMFAAPDAMHLLRQALESDDFSTEGHRRIWARACDLYDRGDSITTTAVYLELQKHNEAESVGGLSGLVEYDASPRIYGLDQYIRTLNDKKLLRRVIFESDAIQKRAFAGQESAQDVLEAWGKGLLSLGTGGATKGPESAKELIARVGINELLNPNRAHGVRLPWTELDTMLWGFHPGELIILAAATSRGKTSMALQCAVYAAQNTGVIYFSREMGNPSVFNRAVNQLAAVDGTRRRSGQLRPEENARIHDAAAALDARPIYFDETTTTVPGIRSAIQRTRIKQPVGLVVVDYLQLLASVDRVQNRAQEVSRLAWGCKQIAMEFQVPVLVLSQFSRDPSKQGREPELWDLKESGDIENHCNVALLLRKGKLESGEDRPYLTGENGQPDLATWPIDVYVAKQREGVRDVRAPMYFQSKFQRFMEAE